MTPLDRMSPRSRAWAMIAAGVLGTIGLWAFRMLASAQLFAEVTDRSYTWLIALAPPAALILGLFELRQQPEQPATRGGSLGGGYLEQQQAEAAWRQRLLAVGLGFVHMLAYIWG